MPMHADRDIVLPILSVRLSNASIVSKRIFGTPTCPNSLTYSDKIWYANTYGGERVLGGQPRPCPKREGPSVPKILGRPTCALTVGETTIKFCMIKLHMRKLAGSIKNADARSVCGS